jgi:hypothetical protein
LSIKVFPPPPVDNVTIEIGPDGKMRIKDGGVTSAKIADGSITSAKIADGSITSAKIADGSVTSAKIADGSITSAKIADGSITSAKIADASVTSLKISKATTYATRALPALTTWTPAAGIYLIGNNGGAFVRHEIWTGADWQVILSLNAAGWSPGALILTDGVNFRLNNTDINPYTAFYRVMS